MCRSRYGGGSPGACSDLLLRHTSVAGYAIAGCVLILPVPPFETFYGGSMDNVKDMNDRTENEATVEVVTKELTLEECDQVAGGYPGFEQTT
jgi:hypothetical protein